ncbi:hypothetical protein PN398_07985 [Romboutsia sp. 1001216sp1]|nr:MULTISPECIES: hypothetical protein [unclassified Romboutsia]MDB8790658.1 hypothetical protein [Romboutsia sp. 1001216sp1]MDB8803277.1 hypothetical protein [Romboutsia sp. 1001216sp1]MDB8814615.1 hypothetical protein [Romboutsia sp. 1001216sp1]
MKKNRFDELTITEKADLVRERAEKIKIKNKNISDLDAFNIAKEELTIEY